MDLHQYLPPEARELAELIGLPALQRLTKWRGGVSVYIPAAETLQDSHPLVLAVGRDAAIALASRYAGDDLEVPRLHGLTTALLHEQIIQRRAAGESESQVALDIGLTGRWVRQIWSRRDEDDGQMDLFDGIL